MMKAQLIHKRKFRQNEKANLYYYNNFNTFFPTTSVFQQLNYYKTLTIF